jgi:hypothetical protein
MELLYLLLCMRDIIVEYNRETLRRLLGRGEGWLHNLEISLNGQ